MMKDHPILFSFVIIIVIVVGMSGALLAFLYLSTDRMSPLQFGDHIALIDIRGVLTDGAPITTLLGEYSKQKNIKAIILYIDSPGGGVAPAQEIYREIERLRRQKPIVAYMSNVAASGGYYVASAASKVVANPGTLTGSIGVIMQFANWEDLLKKIGISGVVIKAGRYKDIGSPTRKMTEEEQQLLENLVKDVHNQFIRDVAKGRNMDEQKVRDIADGRILTGEQAKALGLVDELGNFHDAVQCAKKLANIKGEPKLVRPREQIPSLWEYILRGSIRSLLEELSARTVTMRAVL